jgi:predicted ATPase
VTTSTPTAPFVLAVRFRGEAGDYTDELPALRAVERVELHPRVTFLVGENGSGKSTLVEALAVALKLNPEGGGRVQQFAFSTRSSHSQLHRRLEVERAPLPPRNAFFLRAESVFNLATAIEQAPEPLGRMQDVFERPLHEQSHGESFLALATNRFGGESLYILDEPEAALSVTGALTLLAAITQAARLGAQFVIATHSPIVLACPGARIYQLDEDGIAPCDYDDLDAVQFTRGFLAAPERYLRAALDDD